MAVLGTGADAEGDLVRGHVTAGLRERAAPASVKPSIISLPLTPPLFSFPLPLEAPGGSGHEAKHAYEAVCHKTPEIYTARTPTVRAAASSGKHLQEAVGGGHASPHLRASENAQRHQAPSVSRTEGAAQRNAGQRTHTRTLAHTNTSTHAHTHAYTHTYTRARTHTHTHAHTHTSIILSLYVSSHCESIRKSRADLRPRWNMSCE